MLAAWELPVWGQKKHWLHGQCCLPGNYFPLPLRQVLPPKQVVPRQLALSPKEIALFHLRQVIHRPLAMTLTPREIALFPFRQAVPRQRVLMTRQPATLPNWLALTPRVLVLLSPRLPRQVGRQIMLTIPWGLPEATLWKTPIPMGLDRFR